MNTLPRSNSNWEALKQPQHSGGPLFPHTRTCMHISHLTSPTHGELCWASHTTNTCASSYDSPHTDTQADVRCAAFTLSAGNGCQLRSAANLSPPNSRFSSDTRLACYKALEDWDATGASIAAAALGGSARGLSCVADFLINMNTLQV